jgi:DNA processing protein
MMPTFIAFDFSSFPQPLRHIPRPPAGLWVSGRLPSSSHRSVAVVGARAATGDATLAAFAWSQRLTQAGYQVVSGGALGIDAAAHEGALAAGGQTFAVLGCGVDVVYPDRHADLFHRIGLQGGLLSEYAPGTEPRAGQFPVRNRLIVGLSEAVVVMEAQLRSGALVTAKLAHKQGRRLLAVPGSAGTDALLRNGLAWPVSNDDELLAALDGQRAAGPGPVPMPEPASSIVQAITAGMTTAGAMSLYLGLPLSDVMAALVEAEMDGVIGRGAGAQYEVSYGPQKS